MPIDVSGDMSTLSSYCRYRGSGGTDNILVRALEKERTTLTDEGYHDLWQNHPFGRATNEC